MNLVLDTVSVWWCVCVCTRVFTALNKEAPHPEQICASLEEFQNNKKEEQDSLRIVFSQNRKVSADNFVGV